MNTTPSRKKSGSASIEFAGAMLVFALVMVFIFQMGAMMVAQVNATNAAREGARAAVTLPPSDVGAAVDRATQQFDHTYDVSRTGDSVTVSVQVKTPVMFQVVQDWHWWVHSSATMRRER